jgi:HlyD family secretion protein
MALIEQKRSFTPVFWLAGIAVLVVIVLSIRALTHEVVAVKVAPVTYRMLSSKVSTNGKVEPVEPFQAHAPSPGVVEKIFVDEGQQVKAGQLLVRMDDADAQARVASAKATLAQVELQLSDLNSGGTSDERAMFTANLNSARLEQQSAAENLKAVQALQAKGSASLSEVAAAEQRLKTADVGLQNASARLANRYGSSDRASAQARVADARAALEAAQKGLSAVDIHTPIAGSVYYIPVSEFDFVPAGDDLVYVADLNRLLIRAYFDEPEIGKLADGQPVQIVWEAKPGHIWHGHILHIPNTIINYNTRNVGEAILSVDDAHGDLPPNSNVTVTVIEAEKPNVLSIPREALHTDGSRNFVYRIVGGKLVQTPVQLGALVNNTNAEIAGGLSAGDMVVLGSATPGKELSNGLAVKAVQ